MIGNAIGTFFQRKNGKGGLLPPISSLKGCIGFYMAKGLINEQMSANPVWKDKSGLGNDLQMKNFAWNDQSGVNITDYPGALVFDGVDDYGMCETFPILTKEKGYTVMALRKYITANLAYLVYNGNKASETAFAFERSDSVDTWSWGKNSVIRNLLPSLFSYQTSNSYNNSPIATGIVLEGDTSITVAKTIGNYANVALYSLVIIDHDTTEEERQLVIDYWKKEFPELFTNS